MNQAIAGNNIKPGFEKTLNRVLEGLKVGVLIVSPSSEILYCNKAACDLLDINDEEMEQKEFFLERRNVVSIDNNPMADEYFPCTLVMKSKKPVHHIIMGLHRPHKKDKVWVMVDADPVMDIKGRITEIICSFTDISEHRATEEKLTFLYQSLEDRAFELATSNADLEKFVYVATHDLQEPLRRITSFLQLLKKKYETKLNQQAIEYIEFAVEGSARIKKLILDLLEYSKFRVNQERFSGADMNEVLQQTCKVLSDQLKKSRAELIIHPLPVVTAAPSLMQQLMENLISNAVKYKSSADPVIEINCLRDHEKFIFSVSDNGSGINSDYAEKVFNLFQRLHNNESFEGTGIGLAICEKIVRMHRGTIWVKSEPGKGSTFYFTIPVKQIQ
jgi:PAS domain S-box-containing protein